MNSRVGLLVGVLVLVGVGVYFATRKPPLPEATDDAIVDLVYDELLPKLVLALKPCGLQGQVSGMLVAKTTSTGLVLTAWKDAADAGPLDPTQRTCIEQQLAASTAVNSKTHSIPEGREYEVDVSFPAPGLQNDGQNY